MNINYALKITGNVSTDSVSLNGNLTTNFSTLTGGLFVSTVSRDLDPYEGPYTIEPTLGNIVYAFSEGDVVLNTNDKRMISNVTIKPIAPTEELNFARVTWNGSNITVS